MVSPKVRHDGDKIVDHCGAKVKMILGYEQKNTSDKCPSNCQKGFTLLELLSVMVIMSVMASVSVKKFDLLSDTASANALKAGLRELNTREALVWTQMKLSDTGWPNDAGVFDAIDKNLGTGYGWDPGPNTSGGTLHYKSQSVALSRTQSTRHSVGFWE